MGYVTEDKTTFDALVGAGFDEFVQLSSVHCDGWGIASIDRGQNVATLDRAPERAVNSENFSKALQKTKTDGSLLHLRWATKGLPISENNTHPFVYQGFSFIHNGTISPTGAMDAFIDPKFTHLIEGETDSERYFFFLLTSIEKLGLLEGVKAGVNQIRQSMDYSSINAMVMNENFYVVICEHHPERRPDWAPSDYYELKYRRDEAGVLVASTGWNQPNWETLPNHHLLSVDRATFEVAVSSL